MSAESPRQSTGLPGLDDILHGLRLGDNVVFHVDRLDDYLPFASAFAAQALADGKTVIYFRFARQCVPVIQDDRVRTHRIEPEVGFERFLVDILDVIEQAGPGVFYLFDSLSELAVDWYSDQMLSNFFTITCPYLYQLDTVACFALLRRRHTNQTLDSIVTTAQVVLNVFRHRDVLYVQPLKVDRRHSPTMYALHRWEGDRFVPVTNSATLTDIMATLPQTWLEFSVYRPGLWTRTYLHAEETMIAVNSGKLTFREANDCFLRLLRMAVTRDQRYFDLARRYFDLADLLAILQRMIGTGLIGGKTLGMLLARAMLVRHDSAWQHRLEAHDSFYVGSDVFYTYLVQNGCWWARRRQRHPERFLDDIEETRQRMLHGSFPDHIQHQFAEMLAYFGQSPIIVRSSSLLEDNYGNAFSGKYDSVFCPNQGTPAQRLDAFMKAVRQVYASAMGEDALVYRQHRGLLQQDEQMALLVQRVSGTTCGRYFFPQAAGVCYSFNPFVWHRSIDPRAGFIRLVSGLGTRAVDRTGEDYTRLVALNVPDKRIETTPEALRHYSQRCLDVLDLERNDLRLVPLEAVVREQDGYPLDWLASPDPELAARARAYGRPNEFTHLLTFDRLLEKTPFVQDIRNLLQTLEAGYQYPVDVEFTLNFVNDGEYRLNLLQCRPFQVTRPPGGPAAVQGAAPDDADILFQSAGPVIGNSRLHLVDYLIYVVPRAYAALPTQERYALARLIGRLTRLPALHKRHVVLVGPGRWGTQSPAFGVPVSFQEIRNVSAICELALMHEGLIPDVSLGTHFFNDLVELDMLYLAIFPERPGYLLREDCLRALPNRLAGLLPDASAWAGVVLVLDAASLSPARRLHLRADTVRQQACCYHAPLGGASPA